ncbi:MAG: hypothetical protein D8M55_13395 [Chloroflexi bacterium]|nr:hypothetical protein [Chloroflexota bacterium]
MVVVFGLCAGWFAHKTNSIVAGTIMHFIANLFSLS